MHFQYLVEDQSGAALIRILMEKIVELYPNATYDCKGFRGIGGFTRKNTIKETKTGKLLNDLATYLRGFDRSLQSFPSVIIVVLDSDDHDVQQFRSELEAVAMQNMIKIDHVFCLAVEEIEFKEELCGPHGVLLLGKLLDPNGNELEATDSTIIKLAQDFCPHILMQKCMY